MSGRGLFFASIAILLLAAGSWWGTKRSQESAEIAKHRLTYKTFESQVEQGIDAAVRALSVDLPEQGGRTSAGSSSSYREQEFTCKIRRSANLTSGDVLYRFVAVITWDWSDGEEFDPSIEVRLKSRDHAEPLRALLAEQLDRLGHLYEIRVVGLDK